MMKELSINTQRIVTNLGMSRPTIGDHELTYNNIFDIVLGMFEDRFVLKRKNINASRLLYLAKGIKIYDDIFTQVQLGDLSVLIYDRNLGKKFSGYTHDFAMVNNRPTLFLFSFEITDENIKRSYRTSLIYNLFLDLVQLFMVQEYYNMIGSIYSTIIDYAPMVMTVRLVELIQYPKTFSFDKDYEESDFPENISSWFGQDALDIIHSYTDKELLEFGAGLVEYVESNH